MAYILVRAALLAALFLLLQQATLAAPPAFPLSAGTVWTYRGLVKWTAADSTVKAQTLTWTMTISRTISYRQYVLAVVKGHPLDLAWYDEAVKPGDYSIVYDGVSKYYLLSEENGAQVLARVRAASGDLADLLTPDDLFLALPLKAGKDFANDPSTPRTDHWYCWTVERAWTQPLTGITGLDPTPSHPSFRLAYRTNPDEQVMDFVPGIGLTAFTYIHHGTVAEAHLLLVGFHAG